MKCAVFYTLALACCVGLTLANYYGGASYVPYYGASGSQGGFGNGGILAMVGLLFVLLFLFGNNNSSSGDNILLINSTLEG